MCKLIVKAAAGLCLLLISLVGLARAQPNDDSAVRALFTPPPGCATPCWQGIEIGQATKAEALAILDEHPWIGQIFASDTQISWRWSGAQPALLDGTRDGLIGLRGGVVRLIRLGTTVPFGNFWVLLQQPDEALLVRPLTRFSAFQIVQYRVPGIYIISGVNCPASPAQFWGSTTTLGMGETWTSEAVNSVDFNIYAAEGWWRALRRCRR
jgi:hypothetical protein